LILCSHSVSGQQINLLKKLDASKTKSIRLDKKITIRTFDGEKLKGECRLLDENTILVRRKR
jgi:hypothetical protein